MPADNAGHVRAVAELVATHAARLGEVDAGDDAAAERPVRRDARVNHRDADAPAREAAEPLEAAPHLVGTGRRLGDRHAIDGDVAREMRDVGVLAERDELSAGDVEHGATHEGLLDPRAVARGNGPDLRFGPRDDDAGGLVGTGREAVGKVT